MSPPGDTGPFRAAQAASPPLCQERRTPTWRGRCEACRHAAPAQYQLMLLMILITALALFRLIEFFSHAPRVAPGTVFASGFSHAFGWRLFLLRLEFRNQNLSRIINIVQFSSSSADSSSSSVQCRTGSELVYY
jgi:hypothetical protein